MTSLFFTTSPSIFRDYCILKRTSKQTCGRDRKEATMDPRVLDYPDYSTTKRHACQESEMTGGYLRQASGGLNDQESASTFFTLNNWRLYFSQKSERQASSSLTPHADTIFEEIVRAETSTFRKSKNLFCKVIRRLVLKVVRFAVFLFF